MFWGMAEGGADVVKLPNYVCTTKVQSAGATYLKTVGGQGYTAFETSRNSEISTV